MMRTRTHRAGYRRPPALHLSRRSSMLTRLRQSRVARIVVRRIGVHRVTLLLGLAQLPEIKATELFFGRVRRDRRLVVLGSPLDLFSDNAAYLYVYLAQRQRPL